MARRQNVRGFWPDRMNVGNEVNQPPPVTHKRLPNCQYRAGKRQILIMFLV